MCGEVWRLEVERCERRACSVLAWLHTIRSDFALNDEHRVRGGLWGPVWSLKE
jgi:hypothetical protein